MPLYLGSDYPTATEKDVGSASVGDAVRSFATGVADPITNLVASAQFAAERAGATNLGEILHGITQIAGAGVDWLQEGITPGGKRAAAAEAIPSPGGQSLTDAPLSSAAMKIPAAIPSLALMAVGSAFGGPAGAAGVGSALQTTQVIGQTQRKINAMHDDDLREQSEVYRRLREEDGLDPNAAKRALAGLAVTGMDIFGSAAVGAAGAIPIGRAMTGTATGAGSGIAKRVAGSTFEAGLGSAAGGLDANLAGQSADVRMALRGKVDYGEALHAAANAGVDGALIGAAAGALHRPQSANPQPKPKPKPKADTVDAKGPDAAQREALAGSTRPPEPPIEPPAPPAPAPPIEPPVTEAGNQAPKAPEAPKVEDAGLTVPEKPETLDAQVEQLIAGDRAAILIPAGNSTRPRQPKGTLALKTKHGTFYFDPKRLTRAKILDAIREDRLNEILELGPVNKTEVAARVEQGETPVGVTERTPDGTEVKAAVGTEETAPRQVDALEGSKTEGNTVQVEPVEQVLADRAAPESTLTPAEAPIAEAPQAEAPKAPEPPVTPPVTPSEAPTPAAKVAAVKEKAKKETKPKEPKLTEEPKEPQGSKDKERNARRVENNRVAADAFEAHPASEAETNAVSANRKEMAPARAALLERLRAMVKKARDNGWVFGDPTLNKNGRVRPNIIVENDHGPATIALAEAERLLRRAERGDAERADYQRYLAREALLRKGDRETVVQERLAEGALAKRPQEKPSASEGDEGPSAVERVSNEQAAGETGFTDELADGANIFTRPGKEGITAGREWLRTVDTTRVPPSNEVDAAALRALEGYFGEPYHALKDELEQAEAADFVKGFRSAAGFFGRDGVAEADRTLPHTKDEAPRPQIEAARAEPSPGTVTASEAEARAANVKVENAPKKRSPPLTAKERAEKLADIASRTREEKPTGKLSLLDDVTDPVTGEQATPQQTLSAREMLDRLDLGKMTGVAGQLARAIRNAFMRVVPEDLNVHILDDADFDRLTGSKSATAAYMDGPWADSIIAVRASRIGDADRMRHVILHEATHAVMQRALEKSPDLQKVLTRIAGASEKWLADNGTDAQRAAFEYALRKGDDGQVNLQEFLAETFGKAEVQEVLSGIKADPITLGLLKYGKERPANLFEVVKQLIRRTIERTFEKFGLPKQAVSLMEASLTVGDDLIRRSGAKVDPSDARISFLDDDGKPTVSRAAEAMARQASDTGINLTSLGNKVIDKLRSLDNMARAADRIFGGADNNPIRKIQETVETIRVAAQKNLEASDPLLKKMDQLQRKHMASGQWELFTELQHDANMLNVHPDVDLKHARNKHVGTGIRDVQSRLGHADLAERFAKLDPELQGLWREATSYYAGQQNTLAQKLLTNHLMKALVKKGAQEREAIAQRFFDGKETEADIKEIGQNAYDALKDVNELRRLKGPYFPQMRRGDFVVTAEVTVAPPKDGKVVGQDAYAFDETRLAADFARDVWKKHGLKATVRTEYYDPETGKTYFTDADGTQVKASKLEPDAAKRFVVDVPTRYVSFHETMAEAQRHAADLSGQDGFAKADASPRRFEQSGRSVDLLSSQMRALMARVEGGKAYKELTDAEKDAFKQALDVMSLQMLGSTRVQSRRMPRNFIQGASRDVTRNTLDYAQSMAAHLAKLDHQPTIDEALIKARDMARDGTRNADRTEILNEVEQRLAAPEYVASNTSPAMNRVLQMSFLDKLFSPAYNLINMTQPIVNTVPLLAARHGWGATTSAMTRAYSIIGGGKNLAMGAANTVRAAKGKDTADILTSMRDRLGKAGEQYVRLFDYLEGKGAIGSEAGLEVAKSIRRADGVMGKVDAGLNYADAIARALPEAIETNNRMASAVAAFDLELKKGAGEDAAMRKALDVVNQTQFNYSATNAPTFMKHPLAKVFFQFKKYAQGQYQFLGEQIATALKDADPAARKEAAKVLMNHALMVTAFAGAVGLPTEPIKALLLATAPVTGFSMADFEREIEKLMPEVLSRGLSRGIPGGFAFDLSGRMGENSMLTFGSPKTFKSDDVKAWLFDNLKGAPAGLIEDWISGVNGLLTGDSSKQVESVGKLIPIKMFSDTLDAYRKATEGKTNARGQEKMVPYSPQEAMVRAIGFTPAREANTRAAQSYFYDKARGLKDERSELANAYLKGKTGDERTKAWAKIAKWNATQPAESRITREQLTKQEKSDRKAEQSGRLVNGVRVTKQNERFLSEGNQLYGVR